MANKVYSVTEIYGSSDGSIKDVVANAVQTAGETLRHIEWFEITEIRGHVKNDQIAHFQVGVKLGFRYERST